MEQYIELSWKSWGSMTVIFNNNNNCKIQPGEGRTENPLKKKKK